MKIAFFSDIYKPVISGVTSSITQFADELRRQGHAVYIFSPRLGKHEEPDYYSMTSVPFPIYPDFRVGFPLSIRLQRIMAKLDVDLIHIHTPGPTGLLGLSYSLQHKLPRIMTYHTMIGDYARVYLPKIFPGMVNTVDFFDKFFCNRFHAVTAPTPFIKHYLQEMGIKPKITVIPTGIDLTPYRQDWPEVPEFALAHQQGKKILGIAARAAKEKNIEFVLEVFRVLHDLDPMTHLAVIGGGPHLEELKKYAQKLHISDDTSFTGFVPHEEMPRFIKAIDAFAYTCRTDTQGLVVLEALASGKPLFLIDEKVFKPFVKNGKNGYLLPEDAFLFAKRINQVFHNPDKMQSMSDASAVYSQDFSIADLTSGLVNLYAKTIAAFAQT